MLEGLTLVLNISLQNLDELTHLLNFLLKLRYVYFQIDYRIGQAIDSLVNLKEEGYTGKIDMCFIDGDKVW